MSEYRCVFFVGKALSESIHYNFEQHRRVKILKRSGFEKGDVAISFYKKGEKISK